MNVYENPCNLLPCVSLVGDISLSSFYFGDKMITINSQNTNLSGPYMVPLLGGLICAGVDCCLSSC